MPEYCQETFLETERLIMAKDFKATILNAARAWFYELDDLDRDYFRSIVKDGETGFGFFVHEYIKNETE